MISKIRECRPQWAQFILLDAQYRFAVERMIYPRWPDIISPGVYLTTPEARAICRRQAGCKERFWHFEGMESSNRHLPSGSAADLHRHGEQRECKNRIDLKP